MKSYVGNGEKRKKRIVRLLQEAEQEMRELKREDMSAKDKELEWMRWDEFVVYQQLIEEISTKLEFTWYFPYRLSEHEGMEK